MVRVEEGRKHRPPQYSSDARDGATKTESDETKEDRWRTNKTTPGAKVYLLQVELELGLVVMFVLKNVDAGSPACMSAVDRCSWRSCQPPTSSHARADVRTCSGWQWTPPATTDMRRERSGRNEGTCNLMSAPVRELGAE